MDKQLDAIYDSILVGNREAAREQVQAATDAGVEAEVILKQGLIPAMGEVGRLFEAGDYYVSEMLAAARAMQEAFKIIRLQLVKSGVEPIGKVVIGTIKGDLHDIGKELVAMMMEGAGFEINDLGADVPAQKFVEAVKAGDVDIVAVSALLTTTMPNMQAVIESLDEAGLRDQVKVLVGGAPVTDEFAQAIGADGYEPDASRAASLAKKLVQRE